VLKNDFIILQNSVGMVVMQPKVKIYEISNVHPYGILILYLHFKTPHFASLHTGLHNVHTYGVIFFFKKTQKKAFLRINRQVSPSNFAKFHQVFYFVLHREFYFVKLCGIKYNFDSGLV